MVNCTKFHEEIAMCTLLDWSTAEKKTYVNGLKDFTSKPSTPPCPVS